MRISRKKRPQKPLIPRYNLNYRIQSPTIRVIDENDDNIGIMSTKDAISLAKEKEMDLVEINPKADPPVAKIVDFSHFKYQKEKEVRKQKIKSHVSEMKGIRLSIRISDHDMGVRFNQAEKFLNRGDKVKTEIILRGREAGKKSIGFDILQKFYDKIAEKMDIKYEQEPTLQGNKITSIITKK